MKDIRILVSHPTANQNVRAAVAGLASARMLDLFYTTLATFPGEVTDTLGEIGGLHGLKRRQFNPLLKPFTRTRPWLECARLICTSLRLHSLVRHEHGVFCVDNVYKDLDRYVAGRLKNTTTGIYAYEDGARRSFKKAKVIGIQCLYDLPIGYWRAAQMIFEREREKWPEWQMTLPGLRNSPMKLRNKDEEIRLADRIFVASTFTADTLRLYPGTLPPVAVIPYGFPPAVRDRSYSVSGPLRLLFVGGLTQRKGIAYLFEAIRNLEPFVSLTVVGQPPPIDCPALNMELRKHRWIRSAPHNDVLTLMRNHDVLVFPSLFEGFGLVITEAMSQGTPVITTGCTAGPDLIEHGNNGWLVRAGSTETIRNVLEAILSDRKAIATTGRAALETARRRSWDVYGRELAAALQSDVIVPKTITSYA